MKKLYLECNTGAAGDMLCAALYELLEDKKAFIDKMNTLIEGVTVSAESGCSGALAGTRMRVLVYGHEEHEHHHEHEHEHHHHHATLADITAIIDGLPLSENIRKEAAEVYTLIANAEAKAHGTEPGLVHFHEVGTLDAVADVAGFCLLMETLGIDSVTASPVTTGFGSVTTAHGLLPVPAPATAALLTGIPTRTGNIEKELCTPTGAALLKAFCTSFGERPSMTVTAVGCGLGNMEFPDRPNCLRAFLGETAGEAEEELCEIRANVDDMTGEAAAFAAESLMEAGARDVYIQQVIMKKGRPGMIFVCLCGKSEADRFADLIFKHTTTLGMRIFDCRRIALSRSTEERETPLGKVRYKTAEGRGVTRQKAEYEDVAAIARNSGLSLTEAQAILNKNC